MCLDSTALFPSRHAQQAICVNGECHADTGGTRHHGWNAAQFKPCQAPAVSHQVALALHHMQGQRSLPILVRGEVLRHSRRNCLIAWHDTLDQTTHGFQAQRQGSHIKQQQVVAGVVAGQLIGRNSCA